MAVVFGGQSTEHEISCRSAAAILKHIPRDKFHIAALAVTHDGRLIGQNLERIEQQNNETIEIIDGEKADAQAEQVLAAIRARINGTSYSGKLDDVIIFSILHGTYGEDGCWQGLWELAGLPYIGAGVLGSAVAMDKVVAKKLVEAAGVPVVASISFRSEQWQTDKASILSEAKAKLGDTYFVKPATLGSSVGISKASSAAELEAAITLALTFDEKVLIEKAVDAREIEFAALGYSDPELSLPGEVVAASGFYSYESKYIDKTAAEVIVPARDLNEEKINEGLELAKKAFCALNLFGISRIDFFIEKSTGHYFFNEANTLPGFTSISQYPQLWKAMGRDWQKLISDMAETALYRYRQEAKLKRRV